MRVPYSTSDGLECRSDFGQWKDETRRPQFDRLTRNAVDQRRSFVLRNRTRTMIEQCAHFRRTVVPHAGEQNSSGVGLILICNALKKSGYGWSESIYGSIVQ